MGDSSQTRQFRGLNLHCENRILWFAPHTFTFPQNICQMVICPARGTYINVRMVFLFSRTEEQHLNKTPAQAFTPPAKQKNGTSGHLCITAQAGET